MRFVRNKPFITRLSFDTLHNSLLLCRGDIYFSQVKQLVSEGFNPFFSRRSLAYSDMNVDDARAILLADQEDEDAARQQLEDQYPPEAPMKTVTVEYPKDFDPLATAAAVASPPPQQQQQQKPTPAKKSDVVFEGTTSDLQTLVIESPVPVLLDVYADWCGPCKAIAPVLEELAVEYDGRITIYKVNTDVEQELSAVFGIQSIPTFLFIPLTGTPMLQPGAFPKNVFREVIEDKLLSEPKEEEEASI